MEVENRSMEVVEGMVRQMHLVARHKQKVIDRLTTLRPMAEWEDDDGAVLWYPQPITEPPYCGTLGDSDWPYEGDDRVLMWVPLAVGSSVI